MAENRKTKRELLEELNTLRRRVAQLEQSQGALGKSEQVSQEKEHEHGTVLANIPGMVFRARPDWSVDLVSNSESICGYLPQEFYLQQVNWIDIIHPEDREAVLNEGSELAQASGTLVQEYRIITKSGDVRWVEDHKSSSFTEEGILTGISGVVFDVTEHKKPERRQALRFQILESLDKQGSLEKVCSRIIARVKEYLACEAVALRMREGDDYPYLVNNGFPQEFIESENYLCVHDEEGKYVRDAQGRPVLACMCGIVINAELDRNLPFHTEGGSFWTNSTTELIACTTAETRRGQTCNVCNQHGYESVALIPIRSDGDNKGLLQVNAKRRNLFGPGDIRFLEELGHLIAIAVERKRAEDALRASAQKYRTLVESAGATIATIDKDGVFLFMNTAAAEGLGGKPEDFRGKTMWDLFPKEIADRQMTPVAKAIETNEQENIDVLTQVQKGLRWYNATIQPLEDESGQVTAVMVVARDVHELKQAQERIRTLSSAVEQSIDGVSMTDLLPRLVYVNAAYARMHGYTPEELIGVNPVDLHSEQSVDEGRTALEQIRTRGSWSGEIERIRKDGSVFPSHVSATLLKNSEGQPTGMLVICRDITLSKKVEEELRESETRLNIIFQEAAEGIVLIDTESGGFIDFNKAAYEHLGYTRDEFQKLTIVDIDVVESAEGVKKHIQRIIKKGSDTFETKHRTKDGKIREILVCTGGAVVKGQEYVVGIWTDITESKRKERELASYAAKMARAEQLASVGTVGATMAHELTQPLTVIRLSIENALMDLAKISCPSEIKEELEESLTEVSQIVEIINRLRNFARESAERNIKQVNVKNIAVRITQLLDERAWRVQLAMRLENMDKLPPVLINERDMEQLFFSLVENAVQAADGKKARQLTISGAVESDHLELRFSDNCGGIAPENLDKVFEPFFTTKPAGQGTGLGLCIVERIVSQVEGKVRVESKAGKGSTFFVTLPIKEGGRLHQNGDDRQDQPTRVFR